VGAIGGVISYSIHQIDRLDEFLERDYYPGRLKGRQKGTPMTYEYDLFEKFPDGSSLWRASVIGLEGAKIHVSALAQRSSNTFYAMNVESGKIVPLALPHSAAFRDGLKQGRRSRSAVA
jgi:hypothetical protein